MFRQIPNTTHRPPNAMTPKPTSNLTSVRRRLSAVRGIPAIPEGDVEVWVLYVVRYVGQIGRPYDDREADRDQQTA